MSCSNSSSCSEPGARRRSWQTRSSDPERLRIVDGAPLRTGEFTQGAMAPTAESENDGPGTILLDPGLSRGDGPNHLGDNIGHVTRPSTGRSRIATMVTAYQNQSFDSVKLADKDAFVLCHSSTSFTFQCSSGRTPPETLRSLLASGPLPPWPPATSLRDQRPRTQEVKGSAARTTSNN